MKFLEKINKYKMANNLSNEDIAKKIDMDTIHFEKILDGTTVLSKKEEKEVLEMLNIKFKFTSKKVLRLMDLLFRLGSMVMSLTTLLLCINSEISAKALITLLAIGTVCSSLTMLPKIEK